MTTDINDPHPAPPKIPAVLSQNVPLLPAEELSTFVAGFFHRREHYLEILNRCPSPLYILETSVLDKKSRQFQAAFQEHLPNTSCYYAVKSNNCPEVARILLQTGIGLDVSSGLELQMAIDLGARDIIFSGPGKTTAELELAVREADRLTVLTDSFHELSRLERIAAAHNRVVRIGVRLTTNPNGLWRKFGIVPADLPAFLAAAASCRHLQFTGLQFHTSWNLTPRAQIDYLRSLAAIIGQLPLAARQKIQCIDIGGGYWPPQGEWLQEAGTGAGMARKALGYPPPAAAGHYRLPAQTIESFAGQLSRVIKDSILPILPGCRIAFEPGRWLCNDAMHLLFSVVDKKAPDLVITDAGTNAVGWERFETDYFPVLNLSRPALTERPCDILGSLCTPHDVWGSSYWGESIQPDDILMIPTQGAYTYSLRQNFIKPLPEVVTIP